MVASLGHEHQEEAERDPPNRGQEAETGVVAEALRLLHRSRPVAPAAAVPAVERVSSFHRGRQSLDHPVRGQREVARVAGSCGDGIVGRGVASNQVDDPGTNPVSSSNSPVSAVPSRSNHCAVTLPAS